MMMLPNKIPSLSAADLGQIAKTEADEEDANDRSSVSKKVAKYRKLGRNLSMLLSEGSYVASLLTSGHGNANVVKNEHKIMKP